MFSLVGKIPAAGVINSLQIFSVPKLFLEEAAWAQGLEQKSNSKQTGASQPFLVVAGVGKEPRLGRWLSVKEGDAKNGALVFVFEPRTRTIL